MPEDLSVYISDEFSLYSATLKTKEKFQHILEHAGPYVAARDKMRLFRDDESRASDPGSRCKLRLRHAILMALVHKKDNPTQGVLQAVFGIDQTSVCRYLKVMDQMLVEALPTARNISKEIASCKTKEEFKKTVLGTREATSSQTARTVRCGARQKRLSGA